MEVAVYAVLVLIVAAAIVWALGRLRLQKVTASEPINLFVFMGSPAQIESEAITEYFAWRWGSKVAFRENHAWGDPKGGVSAYILTDGTVHVLVSVSENPAQAGVSRGSANTPGLDDLQKYVLRRHKAHVNIRCLTISRKATESARFTARALLTFLNMPQVIGYSSDSAQAYHPKESLSELVSARSLSPRVLFELLAAIHVTSKGKNIWVHTHGMEQFGAPDLSIRSSEQGKAAYFEALITSAALYVVGHGPTLKPGDTAELAGDGVVYDIRQAAKSRGHCYGRYGALEIARRVE